MWVMVWMGGSVMAGGTLAAITVALFGRGERRRRDALRVLRTVLGIAGTAGAVAVVKFHEAGLL